MIEALGVLAILAALSTVFIPWLLHDLESARRSSESRVMSDMSRALDRAVLRERVVPDDRTWAGMAAAALGAREDWVRTNALGGRRLWIVDPRLRLGPPPGASLPFAQSSPGSQEPVHARVVLLSSFMEPPPPEIRDGVAASEAQFDALWSTPPGAVPGDWSWNGRGEDLFIERLDLTDHWVPVVLNQPAMGPRGGFGTDAEVTNAAPSGGIQAWYLRGTMLRLHDANGRLQASLVVQSPLTLTFERGAWRRPPSWVDPDGHGNGPAVDAAISRFLGAPENPEAALAVPPVTREGVWQSMSNYLATYLEWSSGGFPSTGPGAAAVDAAAALLDSQTRTLLHRP